MAESSEQSIVAYSSEWQEPLVSLWKLCFPDDPPHNEPSRLLEQKLRSQPDWVLVAIQEQVLVGSIVGGYDGVRGWMYHVATHPEFRRRGIGATLVRELERRLRAVGCVKVNLQVRVGNASVTAFYEALGYEIEPRVSLGKRLS